MAVYIEQRTSHATSWCRSTAVFAAVLFIVAAIAHRFELLETAGFLEVLGVVAGLAVLALLFGVVGFRRVWTYGDRGASDLGVGAIVAILVLVPFAIAGYRGLAHPALNDVSTDTVDPPRFVRAIGARSAGMNPVRPISRESARLQADAYPEVTGRRYEAPQERVLASVLTLIDRHGWRILEQPGATLDSPERTVEAVARTPLLGFPSDVAIRITDEGNTTYVDMRSASRYGNRDLGDNAARIAGFLAELDAETAAQAGTLPAE